MKKTLFIVMLLFYVFSFSQETYTFKSGGKVLKGGKVISPEKVRSLLLNDPKTLTQYNGGRNKKTAGNFFLYGGLGIITFKTLNAMITNTPVNKNSSISAFAIGGIIIGLAIPTKIGFSKKIKKAIDSLNENQTKTNTAFIESSDIIANGNGIGISIKF